MQQKNDKLPEVIVFAGPNGSGKSTITKMAKVIEPYINADDIKRTNYCSDLEAAQLAENSDVNVNIMRVRSREALGGHGVPEDKIRSRYEKALKLIAELVEVCDVLHIYDTTSSPFRIFKKRKSEYFFWGNDMWSEETIRKLVSRVQAAYKYCL